MTRDAVQYYYGLVSDRNPGDPKFVDWVNEAKAADLGSLSLIGKRDSVDVIVCRTDAEVTLVDEMEVAMNMFDYETFDDLRDHAKDRTVSVPVYSQDSREAETVRNLEPLADTDLRVLRHPRSTSYFDETKGLAVDDPGVDDRFL